MFFHFFQFEHTLGVGDVRRLLSFVLERYEHFILLPGNRFVFYIEGHTDLYYEYKRDMARLIYFILPNHIAYPLLRQSRMFFIFVRIRNEEFFNRFPRGRYLLSSITFKHSNTYYDTRLFRNVPI